MILIFVTCWTDLILLNKLKTNFLRKLEFITELIKPTFTLASIFL